MPCNSDYMNHTHAEKESGKVLEFLEEIQGQPYNHNRPSYYGRVATLNEDTAKLCDALTSIGDTSKLSLELQLWWRRHQEHDRNRKIEEQAALDKANKIKSAMSKLTADERLALGLE